MLQKIKDVYLVIFINYPLILKLTIISLLAEIGYAIIIPTLPLYLKENLGASVSLIGWIVSSFAFTETLLKTPCGTLGDKIGRKPLIVLGPGVSFISPLLMSLLSNPIFFIPLRCLDGVGAASLWPTISATIADTVKEEERSQAMSIFNAAYLLGLGIGPSFGIFISSFFNSHKYAFYTASILIFSSSLFAAFTLKIPKISKDLPKTNEEIEKNKLKTTPLFIIMLIIAFSQMAAIGLLVPVLPIYAKEVVKLDLTNLGIFFLIPVLLLVIISLPLGRLADRIGKASAIRFGIFLGALGMWLLPFTKNIFVLIFIIFIFGLGFCLATPAWLAKVSEYAKEEKGKVLGAIGTAQGVGLIISPIIGGHLFESLSFTSPFYFSAVLLTFCTILSILYIKDVKEI